MKTKRSLGLYAAVSSLLLCIAGFWWLNDTFFGHIPHEYHRGESLKFSTLRPNELIIVKSAHGDRDVQRREYRFYCAAGARYVDITGNDPSSDREEGPLTMGRELQPAETEGLDATVDWFRTRGEEPAIAVSQYDFEYFRDNRSIGAERFIGYYFPRELAYYRQSLGTKNAEPKSELDRLAQEASLTGAQINRIVPFEQLVPPDVAR